MSPTPGFIMDATSAGTERVGCYATDTDVTAKLPTLLAGTALEAIKGVSSLQAIDDAFDAGVGKQAYTSTRLQWLVAPKTPAGNQPPIGPAK